MLACARRPIRLQALLGCSTLHAVSYHPHKTGDEQAGSEVAVKAMFLRSGTIMCPCLISPESHYLSRMKEQAEENNPGVVEEIKVHWFARRAGCEQLVDSLPNLHSRDTHVEPECNIGGLEDSASTGGYIERGRNETGVEVESEENAAPAEKRRDADDIFHLIPAAWIHGRSRHFT